MNTHFKRISIIAGASIFLLTVYMLSDIDFLKPTIIDTSSESKEERFNKHYISDSINDISSTSIISNIHYRDYQSEFGALPKSLKGTRIPIHFKLDDNNHLIITKSIKQFIEYFLSANAEEDIAVIINRIEEIILQQLPEPAQSEALEVVTQYLNYKNALLNVESQLSGDMSVQSDKHDYQSLFLYRRELRQSNLSSEVYSAFFSDEDKSDEYTAKIIEVKRNPSIDEEEKERQALAAETLLPEYKRKLLELDRLKKNIHNDVMKAKEEGATEAEIYEIRSQGYDHDTVVRFAQADKKNQLWNQRFNQYKLERLKILNAAGLSADDQLNEISLLKQESFSKQEAIRLDTLIRMER
jgi:lipase chaperone LimK